MFSKVNRINNSFILLVLIVFLLLLMPLKQLLRTVIDYGSGTIG